MTERRTFAEILNNSGVDIAAEYSSLHTLFYTKYYSNGFQPICPYDEIANAFPQMNIRGTAITLKDFDKRHGFQFKKADLDKIDISYLVMFCEYVVNLLNSYLMLPEYHDMHYFGWPRDLLSHIDLVIDLIGYESSYDGPHVILVEKSPAAREVAETLPKAISYKVIEYNHYSMQGDLAQKRSTLNELANLLEPRRGTLKNLDPQLENKLFGAFNNFDIRHNNREQGAASYRQSVANLSEDELECIYDSVYALCLTAFLAIENAEGLKAIEGLLRQLRT